MNCGGIANLGKRFHYNIQAMARTHMLGTIYHTNNHRLHIPISLASRNLSFTVPDIRATLQSEEDASQLWSLVTSLTTEFAASMGFAGGNCKSTVILLSCGTYIITDVMHTIRLIHIE